MSCTLASWRTAAAHARTALLCSLTAQVTSSSKPLQPGVWFPEERGALRDRRALLAMASEGSARLELNRTPWQIASDPVQLGFGIYLD